MDVGLQAIPHQNHNVRAMIWCVCVVDDEVSFCIWYGRIYARNIKQNTHHDLANACTCYSKSLLLLFWLCVQKLYTATAADECARLARTKMLSRLLSANKNLCFYKGNAAIIFIGQCAPHTHTHTQTSAPLATRRINITVKWDFVSKDIFAGRAYHIMYHAQRIHRQDLFRMRYYSCLYVYV